MIPLKDYNPTRRLPWVTVLLILVNAGVYFFVQLPVERTDDGQLRFTYRYAAIPCELSEGRPLSNVEIRTDRCDRDVTGRSSRTPFPEKGVYQAVLYSMFLHGSLLHIAGNMLYLWVFGNNIEDRMGAVPYLLFYVAAGAAATLAHVFADASSTIPVIGASGAVAGVMGAYLVLYPNVRIRSLIVMIIILFRDIPAKWLLGFWFVSQFFISPGSGVAWVAHVGGFAFGALVALALRGRLLPGLSAFGAP